MFCNKKLEIILAAIIFITGNYIGNRPTVAFRRDVVEKRITANRFGTTSLPLRAAVEHVPQTLRDASAVEKLQTRDAVVVNAPNIPPVAPVSQLYTSNWWSQRVSAIHSPEQGAGKNIYCFFESWSAYRKSPAAFSANDIDPYLCTHIVYAFAKVNSHTNKLTPVDEEYDIVKGGYRSLIFLKRTNPRLKVLLSVAGPLSNMTSSAANRRTFILSAVRMLQEYGFDGLDLHWEFPGAEDLGGRKDDKEHFSQLVEEMSDIFEARGLILVASVSPSRFRLEDGYDVPRLSHHLKHILLKSFDFHTERNGGATHHSPLTATADQDPLALYFNVDYAVRYWLKRGVKREQLILGIPFYARSYTLKEPSDWIPGSPTVSSGKESRYTQQPGFMAYYEVCETINDNPNNWRLFRDTAGAPFMVMGDQWVGYEDPVSIQIKAKYLRQQGLGGAMVWAIDLDDFYGHCGLRYPLLSTIKAELDPKPLSQILPPTASGEIFIISTAYNDVNNLYEGNECNMSNEEGYLYKNHNSVTYRNVDNVTNTNNNSNFECSVYYKCINHYSTVIKYTYICPGNLRFDPLLDICNIPSLVPCDSSTSTSTVTSLLGTDKGDFRLYNNEKPSEPMPDVKAKGRGPKVVCYFTNWAWYRKSEGKFYPEHIPSNLCTDVIYAFASLDPNDLTIKPFDTWSDIDNNFYARVIARASGDSNVFLSIGGWTDSAGSKYSQLVSDSANRNKFIRSAIELLRKHSFDGLHIDWNYPVCWQSNCKKGPASDKPNFTKFIQELRTAFNKEKPALKLAAAVSGYKEVIDRAYDMKVLSNELDFISVMTFDYHGAWEKVTGHVSPLYGEPSDSFPDYNADSTLQHLVRIGADKSKLVVGVPFYGQSFTLASSDKNMIGDETIEPGDAGEYTKQPGMLAYYEICEKVKKRNWKVQKAKSGPFATSGNQWVSYDDPSSVKEKAKYVKSNGYGGIMAWTLDLDDFTNRCCHESFPLLKNINREFGYINTNDPTSGDCSKPPIPPTPPSVTPTTTPDTGEYIEVESSSSTTSAPVSSSTTSTTEQTLWTPPLSSTTEQTWWTPPSTLSTTQQTWWPTQTTTTTSTTTTRKPRPKPTTTTTSTTTTTTSSTPTTSSTTENLPSSSTTNSNELNNLPITCNTGDYRPVKGNCNAYYRCILGEFRKQHCAGSLHWNNEIKICDWPENAKCKEEIVDGGSQETTVTEAAIPSSSTTGRPDEWWTQPTMTWWSEATTARPVTAKPTVWWSPDTKPTTLIPTTTSTTTSTHTTSVAPSSPLPPTITFPSAQCNNGQYYPITGSCSQFAVCFNGALVAQQCGPGLYWNQQQGMCDWSFNVDCRENYRLAVQWWKLALNSDKDPNAKISDDSGCSRGQFAPHPSNCNKYLQCQWGLYEIYSCPPSLHWNNNRQICDWPGTSACDSSSVGIDNNEQTEGPKLPSSTTTLKPWELNPPSTTTLKPWEWSPPSTTEEWSWTPSTTAKPTKKPPITPPPNYKHPLSGYYKVVCYFTNWAWYRQGIGKYLPEDIDTDLCTHILYGFAVLDSENLIIKAHDSWADFDNHFYERVVAMKIKGLKVLLALGGWNDSLGDKYSRLVNSASARQRFIEHAVSFLLKYDFDGLDLDWEYPKCWQVNCEKGPDSDKESFGLFVKELKTAFRPHNLLLSAAVSPSKAVIDAGYDVKSMAESLDWISVMTYDYHGQWDKKTGHVAPMYYHPDDDYDYFNANFSINYWLSEGVPRRKLVMGMPLYGQSFRLADAKNNSLNAPAPGPGEAGEQTRAAGFLAYYEICDRIQNKGWTIVKDPEDRMGPYAYKGEQWVSFDDHAAIKRKSEYIRQMDLGGGMIWALDLDDFRNTCGGGEHPLLKIIANTLANPPGSVEMVTVESSTAPPATVATEMSPEKKNNQLSSFYYEQYRKALLCELQPHLAGCQKG